MNGFLKHFIFLIKFSLVRKTAFLLQRTGYD